MNYLNVHFLPKKKKTKTKKNGELDMEWNGKYALDATETFTLSLFFLVYCVRCFLLLLLPLLSYHFSNFFHKIKLLFIDIFLIQLNWSEI